MRGLGVHPGSWWLLALAITVASGLSRSWIWLLALSALAVAATQLVRDRRVTRLRTQSIDFYLWLALLIVLIRVAFRVVFNLQGSSSGDSVVLPLPALQISLGFGEPLSLFGPVTAANLEAGFVDGLRLATIVLAIGMANLLANPRRLLKSTPGVLFEIATTVSVAINLAPQLIVSLQRVRRARQLRGRSKGVRALGGLVIPVLEDTLDRSLALAASMDARGFGRVGALSVGITRSIRVLSLAGVIGLGIATYLLLATAGSVWVGLGLALVALAFLGLALRLGSLRNLRTRYQRNKFSGWDAGIATLSILIVAAAFAGWLA